MHQPKVMHWDFVNDGPLSEQAMQDKLALLGYQVNRYIYPPGTHFPEHDHNVDKIDGVLAGCLKITMNGISIILEAGDCLEMPGGVTHSAEVIGNQPVISLDAIKLS